MFFKTGVSLFESQNNLKSEAVCIVLYRLIALSVSQFNLLPTFPPAFVHLLMNSDKLSPYVAELCRVMLIDHDLPMVIGNILREIGRLNGHNLARLSKASESLGMFLTELAQRLPTEIFKYISVIIPHLDGESYKMRNGIIQMIGVLIKYCSKHEEPDVEKRKSIDKEREKLLDLLEIRTKDVVSFSRSRALRTIHDLIFTQCIPANRRPSIIDLAVDRLTDKNAIVRKSAIMLLTEFVRMYHPAYPEAFENRFSELKNEIQFIREKFHQIEIREAKRILAESDEATCKLLFEDSNSENGKSSVVAKESQNSEDHGKDNENYLERNNDIIEDKEHEESISNNGINTNSLNNEFKLPSEEEFKKLREEHLSVSIECQIIEKIHKCIPQLCNLLDSKTVSDILECIKFFIIASKQNVKNWELGFKKMLPLI